jgi:hypothetical protein
MSATPYVTVRSFAVKEDFGTVFAQELVGSNASERLPMSIDLVFRPSSQSANMRGGSFMTSTMRYGLNPSWCGAVKIAILACQRYDSSRKYVQFR